MRRVAARTRGLRVACVLPLTYLPKKNRGETMGPAGNLKETRGRTSNTRTKAIRPKETLLCYENGSLAWVFNSTVRLACMYVYIYVVPQTTPPRVALRWNEPSICFCKPRRLSCRVVPSDRLPGLTVSRCHPFYLGILFQPFMSLSRVHWSIGEWC